MSITGGLVKARKPNSVTGVWVHCVSVYIQVLQNLAGKYSWCVLPTHTGLEGSLSLSGHVLNQIMPHVCTHAYTTSRH